MNEIILKLRDKDDKAAYEYSKLLGAESAQSDKYLPLIPQFADMLEDKSSYVRARGFILICNQARWAKDGQIADIFDRMRVLLYDSKPTVVRQCLLAYVMFIISAKNFSVYNRMHAPQTFYCHEQKAYEHQILFPMSEGSITLVEFSPSDKPS